jgi:hypothetical protein
MRTFQDHRLTKATFGAVPELYAAVTPINSATRKAPSRAIPRPHFLLPTPVRSATAANNRGNVRSHSAYRSHGRGRPEFALLMVAGPSAPHWRCIMYRVASARLAKRTAENGASVVNVRVTQKHEKGLSF